MSFFTDLTREEADKGIHQLVQAIHHAQQLAFDTTELRRLLDDYLRVVEGKSYLTE